MRSLREHRLRWERMGLCSNCGGLKLEPQYKTCAKCRARSRENMRRIYEKVEYPTHPDPIDVKQEIRKDHKCWNCEWKRFEADRFFCPFAEGTCMKEGNILAADVVEEEKEENNED